jgi:hypothetical protein
VTRGRIQDSSVPDLLLSVAANRDTGILTLRNGSVIKSLYLHMGHVIYARSSDPDERMGESLLQRGKITVRQYLEAGQEMQPARRLGTVLVEMGALEPLDLLPVMQLHVKEILLDVLTWAHGEYELIPGEIGFEDVVILSFPMENLILEGIRRTRAWSLVSRGIGDINSVPVPTGNTEVLLKLGLTDDEQHVLTHVNGRASVEQICQVSYLSNLETCRILWALKVLGVIGHGPGGAAPAGEGRKSTPGSNKGPHAGKAQ